MDWLEVLQRIQAGEDERTELGRLRHRGEKDWLKSACALANTHGGLIVLGVQNDGAIDGVPLDPEEVQEHLTSSLQTGLSSPVQARVGRHRSEQGWVHWIEVARQRGSQPLRHAGRVYVRRHRSDVEPSESELMELYNAFGLFFTEERAIPGTGPKDVEVEAFREFMRRRGIDLDATSPLPIEEELRRAEVLTKDLDGRLLVTLYGLLCFGREPQRPQVTRGFHLLLCAYAGTDRAAETLAVAEARGRLDEQVRRAEDWVQGLGRSERYDGLVREDRWILPQRALREALVNAVAHRDYTLLGERAQVDVFDDRVEVTSPGALPNHKTPESVLSGGPPRSRNESIADFLLVQGLMERRGAGFPRMRAAMQGFNGTEPELTTSTAERWVRVTFRRAPPSPPEP